MEAYSHFWSSAGRLEKHEFSFDDVRSLLEGNLLILCLLFDRVIPNLSLFFFFFFSNTKFHTIDAADSVVRIRAYCSKINPSMRVDPIEGMASDYFWSVQNKPDTIEEKTTFVDGLVHATLKQGDVYCAPLDSELVDRYQAKIRLARHRAATQQKEPALLVQWEKVESLFDDTFSELQRNEEAQRVVQAKLHDLVSFLESVKLQHHERQKKGHQEEVADPPVEVANHPVEVADPPAAAAADPPVADPPAPAAPASPDDSDDSDDDSDSSSTERARMKASMDRAAADEESAKIRVEIEKVANEAAGVEQSIYALESEAAVGDISSLSHDEASKKVLALQKKAMEYAWKLERNLNQLDELHVTDSVRPRRKEEIQKIQKALRQVDQIRGSLKELDHKLKAEKPAEEPAPAAAPQSPPSTSPATAATAPSTSPSTTHAPLPPDDDDDLLLKRFADLQLDPRFDVRELRDGYSISAVVPDMKDFRVTVSEEGDTLTVTGYRLPSKNDLKLMRAKLRAAFRLPPNMTATQLNELLLRKFAGQFGQVKKSFGLPPGQIDMKSATAQYERGVIEIVLPKYERFVRPRVAGYVPPQGYGGGGRGRYW